MNIGAESEKMPEMKMTRVNVDLIKKFVKDRPDLQSVLEAKRGFQTIVSIMLRKALEGS